MGAPQGHEFSEGDKGLVKAPEARVESPQFQVGDGARVYTQIAQSTSDLVNRGELGRADFSPDGNSIMFNPNGGTGGGAVELPTFAQTGNGQWRAPIGEQFGTPVIVGPDGTRFLQGYAAKGPADLNITQGLELEDANKLVSAAAKEGLQMVSGTIEHLSKSNAANQDILSTLEHWSQDPDATNNELQAGLDRLGKPMTPEEIGQSGAAMSPWFIFGVKAPVSEARAAEQAGTSVEQLREMTEAERLTRGVEYVPKSYSDAFYEAHPELKGKVVIHHAIPQEVLERYPGVMNATDMHALENLRGIPNEMNAKLHNSEIQQEWNKFFREHRTTTKQELTQFANDIDKRYRKEYLPAPPGGDGQ